MAAPLGSKTDSVDLALIEKSLRAQPWSYDFFQAVRLLGMLQRDREPVGEFAHPSREITRFGVHQSLAFPASQIQSLEWQDRDAPLLRVNFMGLTGPLGVLPLPYTELILERLRARDTTLLAFLDLFHHRILSLFYRAWERSRITVTYEQSVTHRQRASAFSSLLFSLAAVGTPGLRNRSAVPDETSVYYGGLFSLATRPAAALEAIIADYFDVEVELEQNIGVWRPLGDHDLCMLDEGDPDSYRLGFGAVTGEEIWDRQSRARIRIGPLSADRFQDFLPTGSAFQPLQALVRSFQGESTEFELQILLNRGDVPRCELGGDAQLGWFTWLKSKPDLGRDPGDTVLLLN